MAEAPLDGLNQLVGRYRFSQDARKFGRIEIARVTSDDDDRNLLRDDVRGEFASNVASAQAREAEIEHDEIGCARVDKVKCLDAVLCGDDVVAADH